MNTDNGKNGKPEEGRNGEMEERKKRKKTSEFGLERLIDDRVNPKIPKSNESKF